LFNNKTDNETDFCESYKSQILDTNSSEDGSLFNSILKIMTVILLLITLIAGAIYGYNYYINNKKVDNDIIPPISVQVLDEELKVQDIPDEVDTKVSEEVVEEVEVEEEPIISETKIVEEVKEAVVIENKVEEVIEEPSVKVNEPVIQKTQESDIDKIANDIKLAIAKSEEEEKNSKQIEIEKEEVPEEPISAPEAQYLEELAELSKEIDKERK